ncbi:MAG: DUF3108 domain-containing protein [Gammaproteobacteria bacterium]
MPISKKILTLVVLLILPGAVPAADLQPYEAVYKTRLRGFDVNVKRRLTVQDSRVTVSVDAKRFLFRIHESTVLQELDDGRLSSVTYEQRRKGLSRKHDKQLVFDRTENSVVDLLEPDRPPLAVGSPIYDKLGYQAQMRLDLMRNPDLKLAQYAVTNGVRNRTYTFDCVGEEIIDTPLGKLRTLKFERRRDDDERQVAVWVASDWDYLLVRIDQTRKPGAKTERLMLKRAKIGDRQVVGL